MRFIPVLRSRKGRPLDFERYQKEIDALCRKFQLGLLYVFGSYASRRAGALSDLDLAYLPMRKVDALKMLALFQDLFEEEAIDLVDLRHAPPTLRHQVLAHGRCLYVRNLTTKIDFETRAQAEYFDLEPLRRTYFQQMLKRIEHGTFGN